MPSYYADFIYTPKQWVGEHILILDEEGTVLDLRSGLPQDADIIVEGALCPGLINAHCHLELSALRGKIDQGTGMAGFISQLQGERNSISPEIEQEEITKAIEEAYRSGTQAIGDVCNTGKTAALKREYSHIGFINFVEVFGLDAGRLPGIKQHLEEVLDLFEGLKVYPTLHAPYSVSAELRDFIYKKFSGPFSIHLLESSAERGWVEKRSGPLLDLFRAMGLNFERRATRDLLDYILLGHSGNRTLWIHLLEAREDELKRLSQLGEDTFFCLCPRSNKFIHSKMPTGSLFKDYEDLICLGTDSLASNYNLDLWEEVLSLLEVWPEIGLHTAIKFTTTNAARALGIEDQFGIFKPGTNPGLIQVSGFDKEKLNLAPETRINRLK